MKVDKENCELPEDTTHRKRRLRPADYFIVGMFFTVLLVILVLNFTQYKSAKTANTTSATAVVSSYTADSSKPGEEQENEDISSNDTSVSSENASSSAVSSTSAESSNPLLININTATKEQLMELTYIGEAKAQNIIDYRNNYGPFSDPSQITNVTGIGDKIYEQNKDRIVVE